MKSGTQKLKKFLAFVMTAVMMLTAVPLGGLTFNASAENEEYYTYTVKNGEASITDCDESISGDVVIPDTLGGYPVTSIGWSAFKGCTGLTSITIPDSVTGIGGWAFCGCTGLTSIVIPDSVTSIDNSAFEDCTGLTSITIPDSVTSIGWVAFGNTAYYNDDSNWEDDVLYIGNHLIEAKNSISGAYDVKDGTKTIADWAFSGCTGLTSITIPDSVTSIGESAFDNTAYYNNNSDDVLYIGNHLIKAKYSISGAYDIKDGTKTIADNAFDGCTGLTSITIPDSVTSIGWSAFKGCTGLTELTIGNSVTSIGDSAFRNCTSLTSIIIPDSVTSIGEVTFYGCTGLTSVTIPDSVTSIGGWAFAHCISLTSITIPDNVKSIGGSAFHRCTGLTSITVSPENTVYHSTNNCLIETDKKMLITGCKNSVIPADGSVVSIDYDAFYDCTGLTSITIPDSVTSIGDSAFYDCSGLTSVTIGNSVTSIGEQVFHRCTSLTSVTIGSSVTSIGYEAFYECTNLTSITIPDSVTSIGSLAFSGCTGLTSITIPDSVTSIGGYAFQGCTSLTSVTIPNSMTSIGEGAFYYCTSLASIAIPSSVTDIGDQAFGYYFDKSTYEYEKVDNFTIYGYTGTAAETYANENGFAFIALDEEHTHTYSDWVVITEPTCTAEGEETRTCSVCGEKETRPVEKKAHDLNNVKIDSTCTIAGVSYDVCSECQQTFNYVTLPLAAHTFGEWTVTKEATAFEFGEKVRICSVCGFEEKEKIEKLPVSEVKDEKTGISVVCPDGSYDGEVEIEVSEVFDGTSYNILNAEKGNFKNALFDITTVIDGEKVQPNGSVFVKIPLPDGYNAEKTVVYYITNDGRLEKMDSRVEDGYIVFETTHFSFYAIVDETEKQPENPSENCSCGCHKGGIAKLFFKIKLFFQKIFKKNRVCKCGVNHY